MFVLVEPTITTSDISVSVAKQSDDVLVTEIQLPFVVQKEQSNPPSVTLQVHHQPEDTSLVELVDWIVSDVDKESETCVLSCSLSVDSDKLYKMKQLPLIQIEVTTQDGLRSHKHDINLQLGNFVSFDYVVYE